MKNIVVAISAVVIVALMVITYQGGSTFQGGEAGKVIENIQKTEVVKQSSHEREKEIQKDIKRDNDNLNALKSKAGNLTSFKVSNKYRSRCSSCHGADGSGMQNGKKMMGPKLFGQSEESIYKALVDFKSGRVENLIMRGLLINMSDDDFREYAKEISEFKERAEANK